jgi:hypothetical protein
VRGERSASDALRDELRKSGARAEVAAPGVSLDLGALS